MKKTLALLNEMTESWISLEEGDDQMDVPKVKLTRPRRDSKEDSYLGLSSERTIA